MDNVRTAARNVCAACTVVQLGGFWLPGMAVRLTATGPDPGAGGSGGGAGGGGGPGDPVGVGDGVEVPIVTLIAALALRERQQIACLECKEVQSKTDLQ